MNKFWRGLVLALILVTFWTWRQLPDNRLHLVFCDVGQGDASLIVKGSFQMLIDTGPSPTKILSCLGEHLPFWDRQIELVVTTHQEKDHNGGLAEVEKRYKVVRSLGKELVLGDVFRYADLYFEILWPVRGEEIASTNEGSVVGRLSYGRFKALFTADIGQESELALVQSGVLEKMILIKVPHHGSKYSSSQKFLEEIQNQVHLRVI